MRGAVLMVDSCSFTLHRSWPLLLQRVLLSFALSRNPFQYHTTKTEQQTLLWSVFTRIDTRGQADRPRITLLGTLQAETPFPLFLIKDGKRGVPSIASSHWSHLSPNFWTRQSCFLSSTWFFQCEHPFIDKSMVITESAVQHMLNVDVTRFMQSLSQEHRNRTSERKTLIPGWLSGTFLCHHWKLDLLQLDHTSFLESGASL